MQGIRKPAVAGSFYPGDIRDLDIAVKNHLKSAKPQGVVPKAIIAPHAGFIYSGPIAASAYAQILPAKDIIKKVVLLGPSHRVPLQGLAASSAKAFSTPLGEVPLDQEAIQKILKFPQVTLMEEAHRLEHSLEVHLPFLQKILTNFKLIPLVVGDAEGEDVAEVLEALWGGEETLIVISSDLSHYHDYQTAKKRDQKTTNAIERLAPEEIDYEDACGRNPIKGLLVLAKKRGLKATTLDVRNSGDTQGSRDQVVGYGAYAFQ